MRKHFALIIAACGSATLFSGCQSLGNLTPQQVAQLNCVVAADGATVIAVVRPGLALPAAGLSKVGCDAGTQVGDILGTK